VNDQPASPQRRSGLRNPAAAARGLGVATLLLEALALLMAVQPLRVLGAPTVAVAAVGLLVGVAVSLAALLRFSITWYLAWAFQVAVLLTGLFQWALAALGVAFCLVWWYVLHVRRTILTTPGGQGPPGGGGE
jgi:hypothetical protein